MIPMVQQPRRPEMRPHSLEIGEQQREKRAIRAGFTLLELLVVIAIIGILAALIVPAAGMVSVKMRTSRTQAERKRIESAIEEYKLTIGFYPPDNVNAQGVVNPVLNPLLYELTGVIKDKSGPDRVRGPFDNKYLTPSVIQAAFNRDGFVNAADDQATAKRFLSLRAKDARAVKVPGAGSEVQVYVLAALDWNPGKPGSAFNDPTNVVNPWRYVSTNPTNNPGRYDLWAPIFAGKQIITNSNW